MSYTVTGGLSRDHIVNIYNWFHIKNIKLQHQLREARRKIVYWRANANVIRCHTAIPAPEILSNIPLSDEEFDVTGTVVKIDK